ncbi:MAG: thioredoxin-disulfide reductase [Anaerolineales bacterium]|jgi:thioredoxin reductase (NADPH)
MEIPTGAEKQETHKGDAASPLDVLVLGSGPAGLAAALYAARADRAPLVLSGQEVGGQASLTNTIENYPGFPDGVPGAALGELFRKQAERFGARMELDSATGVDLRSWPFRVKTYSAEYLSRVLIIATGASPRKLAVPGEQELVGRGVSYCATCDGWFFKGKEVVVVGGGDSALEESLFLTRYATRVTIVHRRKELRAGKILLERAKRSPKVSFLYETVIDGIQGESAVDGVLVRNVRTGEQGAIRTQGVFIFIGQEPNSAIFRGQIEMDARGYVIVDAHMQTSIPGVFAAGEIADPIFRQVATSSGAGVVAAISAEHWLAEQEGERVLARPA